MIGHTGKLVLGIPGPRQDGHIPISCRNAGKTSDAELLGLTFMDDPTFPSFRF